MENKEEVISFLKELIQELEKPSTEIENVDINIDFDRDVHNLPDGTKMRSVLKRSIEINLDVISHGLKVL